MQSCWLAAATGLKKKEKRAIIGGRGLKAKKNVVKGPGQQETKVMMMS